MLAGCLEHSQGSVKPAHDTLFCVMKGKSGGRVRPAASDEAHLGSREL